MHLRQIEHAGRQMEARYTQSKHTLTRLQFLQRQNNANYSTEAQYIVNSLHLVHWNQVQKLSSIDYMLEELGGYLLAGWYTLWLAIYILWLGGGNPIVSEIRWAWKSNFAQIEALLKANVGLKIQPSKYLL